MALIDDRLIRMFDQIVKIVDSESEYLEHEYTKEQNHIQARAIENSLHLTEILFDKLYFLKTERKYFLQNML